MITKENAAEYLPLVQALAEGKTVQKYMPPVVFSDVAMASFGWSTIENIDTSDRPSCYRIKPEPKLVPYTEADARWLVGRKAKRKSDGGICIIVKYSQRINGFLLENTWASVLNLFEDWIDVTDDETGKPFGREVVE